jgi:hypothetical protein
MTTDTKPTEPAADPPPVPAGAELRQVIREELEKMLPTVGGDDPDPSGDDPDPDEPDSLTLRQITERALRLTTKALDRIPGAAVKPAGEPAPVAPQKPPVPRALKFLGFADPE